MTERDHISMAPSDDCERFVELLIEDPENGRLVSENRLFVETHSESCPSCAALLEASVSAARDLPPLSDALMDSVLTSRFDARPRVPSWTKVAALVACAAAVVVFIVLGPLGTAPNEPDGAPAVMRDGSDEAFGQSDRIVADARAKLLTSEGNLELALERGTEISLPVLTTSRVDVALERGFLAAYLVRGSGRAVQVSTRHGRVRVTGTVFSVETDGRDTRVGVVEGTVQVSSADDDKKLADVTEGQSFSISEFSFEALSPDKRAHIRSLLAMDTPTPTNAAPDAQPSTSLAPSAETITPVDDADTETPGARESTLRAKKDAAVDDDVDAPTQRVDRRSPSDYILEARELRKLSDWRGAAERYRLLLSHYPNSHEAATVLLPLAELELNHLGRAKAALTHFEGYLARNPSGAMAEEALWGKCGALRALGRNSLEKQNLEIFVEKFPQSMHIVRAQARLVAIDKGSVEKK